MSDLTEDELRDLYPLPFIGQGEHGTDWWRVEPTGHEATDADTGDMYAALALAVAKQNNEPAILAMILRDMILCGRFTALEAAFLVGIASAAKAGSMN